MKKAELMTRYYLAAVNFTETGGEDQPDCGTDFTPLFKAQAFIDCRNFLVAIGSGAGEPPINGIDDLNVAQLGHDLWLTRNWHGTGFWDRDPNVYTSTQATLFCRLARAMGEHDAEFIEEPLEIQP